MSLNADLVNHGTIIRTGIACKKNPLLICATQLVGGLLLKMLKYFKVMLNFFEFSRVKEIVQSWLVYAKKFSRIIQSLFLTETIKES